MPCLWTNALTVTVSCPQGNPFHWSEYFTNRTSPISVISFTKGSLKNTFSLKQKKAPNCKNRVTLRKSQTRVKRSALGKKMRPGRYSSVMYKHLAVKCHSGIGGMWHDWRGIILHSRSVWYVEKTEKGRDIGKRTTMNLSPSKLVFNHITFDEQIQEQYLCDVW